LNFDLSNFFSSSNIKKHGIDQNLLEKLKAIYSFIFFKQYKKEKQKKNKHT